MKIKGFNNSNIYVGGVGIVNTSLAVENGKIASVGTGGGLALRNGLYVLPGFVDEHIHGANGSDAMDATPSALSNISRSILAEGTTSFLFTTMTVQKSGILKALKAIGEFIRAGKFGAQPLGVHLEGPFLSNKFAGAQNPSDILPPDTATLHEFHEASGRNLKLVTFSYDSSRNEFLEELKKLGIVPALGHTDCGSDDALAGFERGIRSGTHTFNAMRGVHHREIGTAGALLLHGNVACELICDLHHVSANAIRLLYKCKGGGKILLVTDSMEAKYLPDGEYALGGNKVFAKGGVARLADGTLAGSTLKMNEAVRNVKNVLGISLTEAVDMATKNPAENLGVFERKGSVNAGKDADFTIVDGDFNVVATIVGGEILYQNGELE